MAAISKNEKIAIRKTIIQIIIPVIVENILSVLAALLTSVMLGHLDSIGMSSVVAVSSQGIALQLNNMIWYLFKGVSIGGTIVIAQARGREDEIQMQNLSRTLIKTLVIFSFPIAIVLFFLSEPLLKGLFNPSPEVLSLGSKYLKIAVLGFPALAIMLSNTGIYQGRGDTKTPMFITLFYNVVNVMIAAPLVLGFPFGKAMGSTGAAIALVVAQYLTAILGAVGMFRPGGVLNPEIVSKDQINPFFSFQGGAMIWKKGIPSSLENIFWQISAIIMGSVFMSYGEISYTANQLGQQAEALADMPAIGFGIASTTLVGSLVAAKQMVLGREYMRELHNMAIVMVSVGTLVLVCFPSQLMGLLTSNQEVIKLGSRYVITMGVILIPQNLQRIYVGALKGVGKTIWPMIIAGIGIWIIRIPLALSIFYFTDWPVWTIWLVVAIDQVSKYVISLIVYKKQDIWAVEAEVEVATEKEKATEVEADAEIEA